MTDLADLRKKKQLLKSAGLHGLLINDDAVAFILKKMQEEGDDTLFNRLLESIDVQSLPNSRLDLRIVERSIKALFSTEQDGEESTFAVISAFDAPKWKYDEATRLFIRIEAKPAMFGNVDSRREMFRDRYNLIAQRIERNALFERPVLPNDESRREYHRLTQIHSLRGSVGELKTVLGVLTQPEDNQFYLEDLTESVAVDLSQAVRTPGLFGEGVIVIARGQLRDGKFVVSELGLPPAERRNETLENVNALGVGAAMPDFFGAPWNDEARVQRAAAAADQRIVILSDVRLNDDVVMRKLLQLFDGYLQSTVPRAFILIGNFCSPEREDALRALMSAMERLGNELAQRPALLEQSTIVFVPGPADPGGLSVRNSKTESLIFCTMNQNAISSQPKVRRMPARVRERIVLTSNPCRLRFGERQIVVFREDIVEKLRRQCLVPPSDDESTRDLSQHAVKTILDQAHLCPVAVTGRPVTWQLDHSLHLYPVPHAVVLADRAAQYNHLYDDCRVLNPSSFHIDFAFVEYAVVDGSANFLVVQLKPTDNDNTAATTSTAADNDDDEDENENENEQKSTKQDDDDDDQNNVEQNQDSNDNNVLIDNVANNDAESRQTQTAPQTQRSLSDAVVDVVPEIGGAFEVPTDANDDDIVDNFDDIDNNNNNHETRTANSNIITNGNSNNNTNDDDEVEEIDEDDPRRVVLDTQDDETLPQQNESVVEHTTQQADDDVAVDADLDAIAKRRRNAAGDDDNDDENEQPSHDDIDDVEITQD